MITFLQFFARHRSAATAPAPLSPAASLLEHAAHRAGADPHAAAELRSAASAWLRVVR